MIINIQIVKYFRLFLLKLVQLIKRCILIIFPDTIWFYVNILYIAGYVYGIWQGFSDIQKNGQFVSLSSGRAPHYVHWMTGEPNNAHGGTEHCVTYIPYYRGWNDARCSRKEYFVCTKPKRTPCTIPCRWQCLTSCLKLRNVMIKCPMMYSFGYFWIHSDTQNDVHALQ